MATHPIWRQRSAVWLALAWLHCSCSSTDGSPAKAAAADASPADSQNGDGQDAPAETAGKADVPADAAPEQDGDAAAISPPAALCLTATETTFAKDALATQALVAAGDGHLLLGGSTYFIEKSYPAAGAWAVRVDGGQNLVWQRDLRNDEQWRRAVHGVELADKTLAVVGYSDGALAEGGSYFVPVPRVLKMAPDGKTLWSKTFAERAVQARYVVAKTDGPPLGGQLQVVGAHAGHNNKIWLATLDAATGEMASQLDVPIAHLYQLTGIAHHASGVFGIASMSNTPGTDGSYHLHAQFTVIHAATAAVHTQEDPAADTVTAGAWPTAAGFAVVSSTPKKAGWILQYYSAAGAKGASFGLDVGQGWAPSLAVFGGTANLHLLLEHRQPDKVFALSHRWTVWTPAGLLLADVPIDNNIGSPWTGGVVQADNELVLLGPWDTYSTGSSEATNVVSKGATVARFHTSALPCK